MSIVDTICKLKIQANALMRGIHADFVLIERADLEDLLKDYQRLSVAAFDRAQSQVGSTDLQRKGSTDSVWSNIPAEFKHDLLMNSGMRREQFQQDFKAEVCEHRFDDYHGRPTEHCYYCGKDKKENYIERGTNAFTASVPPINPAGCEPLKSLVQEDAKPIVQQAFEDAIRFGRSTLEVSYPDMKGEPTIGFKPYNPKTDFTAAPANPQLMRAIAADCAHEWIPHPEHHTSRCKHCGATRSES